jgi:hypothetical protein
MGYVDAHTHVWFKEALPKDFFFNDSGYEYTPPSVQDITNEMDSANIDYIVIIAYPSREIWRTKEDFPINMIRVVKEYANRFSIVGGIEPNKLNLNEAKEWLEKQYEAGFPALSCIQSTLM